MLISSPHRPEVSHKQPDRWLPVFILVLWLCQRTVLNPDTKAFRSITKNAPTSCVLAVNIRTIRYLTAQTKKHSITTEQTLYIYSQWLLRDLRPVCRSFEHTVTFNSHREKHYSIDYQQIFHPLPRSEQQTASPADCNASFRLEWLIWHMWALWIWLT